MRDLSVLRLRLCVLSTSADESCRASASSVSERPYEIALTPPPGAIAEKLPEAVAATRRHPSALTGD